MKHQHRPRRTKLNETKPSKRTKKSHLHCKSTRLSPLQFNAPISFILSRKISCCIAMSVAAHCNLDKNVELYQNDVNYQTLSIDCDWHRVNIRVNLCIVLHSNKSVKVDFNIKTSIVVAKRDRNTNTEVFTM